MPEEYKIDYTGIQIPDIESIKRTSQQFTDWRRSMGFQTEEEKNAALKAEMQAAQQRFNDQGLWNSEDPYEVYNAYETDPIKQAEFRRNGQIVAGVGSTLATLPFTAGMMGWVPALTTTATGAVGGYAGSYGGQKLGQYLDGKYGWNTTPYLSFFGGLGGGMLGGGLGYRGTVKLGSRGWLPKNNSIGNLYDKQFITDVASDALSRNVRQTTPALNYGTVKYYGPTMGKTTAAKTNPNLVDFDDYVRGDLDALASQLGMTRQQLMMSQDPTIRENARQLMLKSIEGWRQNPSSYGKTLVISKSDVLQDPIFDNQPLVLQRSEFLKRNAARGETNLQNSMDWYASTRRKGGNKLMEWPDPEGVYISELEPFTPDPHHIAFTPTQSSLNFFPESTSPRTSAIIDNFDNVFDTWHKSWTKGQSRPVTYNDLDFFVLTANEPLLLRNYSAFIDDLKSSSLYHSALTPDSVRKELSLMRLPETDVNINDTPIGLFLQHDALPRLLDNFKKSGVKLAPDDVDWITDLYTNPTRGLDMKIGYTTPGSGGYSRGPGFIRFSNRHFLFGEDIPLDIILHELHHSMRTRLQDFLRAKGYDVSGPVDPLLLSTDLRRAVSQRGAYLQNELDTMLPLHMSAKYLSDLTPTAEIGAVTSSNSRFPIWLEKYNSLGRVPTISETNKAIRSIPKWEFVNKAMTGPYGQQIGSGIWDDFRFETSKLPPFSDVRSIREQHAKTYMNAFKKAMETIAGITLPVAAYSYINNETK